MNHPDPHQEASNEALIEEHEAHPERFTRVEIVVTSNLIQAAKLLGGKYRRIGQRHLIDLPCGRSVTFQEYFRGMWSIFPSWDKSTYTVETQNSPRKISRHVRSLVVKNDEQIS